MTIDEIRERQAFRKAVAARRAGRIEDISANHQLQKAIDDIDYLLGMVDGLPVTRRRVASGRK